jgi:hypothetical protein
VFFASGGSTFTHLNLGCIHRDIDADETVFQVPFIATSKVSKSAAHHV